MRLYDYIYVDLDKVISLYSQVTGGVVEVRQMQSGSSSTAINKRSYDFRVFKHDAGGSSDKNESSTDTVKPHHALLQELEELLANSGLLLDLSKLDDGVTLKSIPLRDEIRKSLCVKVTGRVVFEDYD